MRTRPYMLAISFFICALVLVFSVRGLPGNPTANELNTRQWKDFGPFELSPERGRFALLYTLIENRSVFMNADLARFAAPDVALAPNGLYASLFAPGVSFVLIPGYFLGKQFALAQVGAVAVIAFFALMNATLIFLIARELKASSSAAFLGGMSFLFATPAFAYAVSMYQHHISVFLLLLCVYLLIRFSGWWPVAAVWFLYGVAFMVDNPNALLLAPVMLLSITRIVQASFSKERLRIGVQTAGLVAIVAVIIPLLAYAWFNSVSNGLPTRLSGTLPQVRSVDAAGMPSDPDPQRISESITEASEKRDQEAVSFFQSRNLLNGFFVHSVSLDRGMVWYAPVVLIGIAGLVVLYVSEAALANVFFGIVGVTFVLYSMWGDPYGGWAFGSRYLIPAYAALCIGISLSLSRLRFSLAAMVVFVLLLGYSLAINTLGALTSSANPPQIEVLDLERIYGKEQKYSYDRNWQYLHEQGSKAFVFQAYAKRFTTAIHYYWAVVVMLWGLALWHVFRLRREVSRAST